MRRREFIGTAVGTGLLYASPVSRAVSSNPNPIPSAERPSPLAPMALGLLIKPSQGLEATIARAKALGIPSCRFHNEIADGVSSEVTWDKLQQNSEVYSLGMDITQFK